MDTLVCISFENSDLCKCDMGRLNAPWNISVRIQIHRYVLQLVFSISLCKIGSFSINLQVYCHISDHGILISRFALYAV